MPQQPLPFRPERPLSLQVTYELLMMVAATLISASLFSFVGSLLAHQWFGVTASQLEQFGPGSPKRVTHAFKLVQAFSAVGAFIVPAWFISKLLGRSLHELVQWRGSAHGGLVLLAALAVVAAQPAINSLQQFNMQLQLPEQWDAAQQALEGMESRAARFTEGFLEMPGWPSFLVNTLVIALLPALGEELFFRGILQNRIRHWSGNGHVAVWIGAAVFSAVHLQFFGFLPRLLLGALFGYLYWWGGHLAYPIAGHFVNNFGALAVTFFRPEKDVQSINQPMDFPFAADIISLLVLIAIVFGFRAYSRRRKTRSPVPGLPSGDWIEVYDTNDRIEAEILQGALESRGIRAVIIDKQDSAYRFGFVALYVPDDYLQEAKHIVREQKTQ